MSITRWSLQSKSEVQELLEAQPRTTLASWVLSNLLKWIWTAESMKHGGHNALVRAEILHMVYLKLFMKIHIFEKTVHGKFASLNQSESKKKHVSFFSSMLKSHGANYTVKMYTCLVFTLFSFSCLCKALTMDGIWVVRRFTGLQRAKK